MPFHDHKTENMPIEKYTKNSPFIFDITENLSISKYVDIVKFLSILQTNSLFFCRVDKLEDRFEGVSPKTNTVFLEQWLTHLSKEYKSVDVQKKLSIRKDVEERFKKVMCVCCWNKFSYESYAMWKIYSDINKGIMIKSNIENLKLSFNQTEEKIQLSDIKYIDIENEMIEPSSLTSPIIHKHKAYFYENEIRLLHQVGENGNLEFDWSNEPISNGKNIKVDLNILIEEVILSPYSPDWFLRMIKDLMEKYNLNKEIKFSTLK
jgi:hypothetical protein